MTTRKRPKKPAPEIGERLQRVMADAGVASRRECERLIESGAVEVNGEIVTSLPVFVQPDDRILVEGRPIRKSPERKLYLMLNKPARTLTTLADEPGADRRTVMDLIDHPQKSRLFPVGRLDFDSTGLLLITNDGELANKLTHPRFGVAKTYLVVVKGRIEEDAVAELEEGIYLADRKSGRTTGASRTARVEVKIVAIDRDKTTLELTLREGRNRQVRRLLAAVGFPVKSLERVGMGPVRLKGVARGQWRELDAREIGSLRKAANADPTAPKAPTPKRPAAKPKRTTTTSARSSAKPARTTAGKASPTSKPPRTTTDSARKTDKPARTTTDKSARTTTGKPARTTKPSTSNSKTRPGGANDPAKPSSRPAKPAPRTGKPPARTTKGRSTRGRNAD